MKRILLVAMLLCLVCIGTTQGENYAVIISGSAPGQPFFQADFWYDTYLLWEALYTFGWKDENIHVLFGYGQDWYQYDPTWERYLPWTYYYLQSITDDSARYVDVVQVFEQLAAVMTEEDLLFVCTLDHGGEIQGNQTLCLVDSEMVDTVFAELTLQCAYGRRVFCMEQCFSTGFCEELAGEPNTFTMSSGEATVTGNADNHFPDGADTLENEIHNGDVYAHGELYYHMINALRLQTIVGNPLPYPDLDQNGLSSMKEVGSWTDSTESQDPLDVLCRDYDDIGDGTFLNIPPYAPEGFEGERINNYVHLYWNPNMEYDFDRYNIYKRTYEDSTQTYTDWYLLDQTTDTSYTDLDFAPTNQGSDTVWYKIAAVDQADLVSDYSDVLSAPGVIRSAGDNAFEWVLCSCQDFRLGNYPNPFNAQTVIHFTLPNSAFVRLSIYDVAGREIVRLTEGWKESGTYDVLFDGSDLPSGIYLCTIKAGGQVFSQKMVLLK